MQIAPQTQAIMLLTVPFGESVRSSVPRVRPAVPRESAPEPTCRSWKDPLSLGRCWMGSACCGRQARWPLPRRASWRRRRTTAGPIWRPNPNIAWVTCVPSKNNPEATFNRTLLRPSPVHLCYCGRTKQNAVLDVRKSMVRRII